MEQVGNIFGNIWAKIVEFYGIYSSAIHSVFPSQLGDLVEYVIDIAVACLIIKGISSVAFGTKGNG